MSYNWNLSNLGCIAKTYTRYAKKHDEAGDFDKERNLLHFFAKYLLYSGIAKA